MKHIIILFFGAFLFSCGESQTTEDLQKKAEKVEVNAANFEGKWDAKVAGFMDRKRTIRDTLNVEMTFQNGIAGVKAKGKVQEVDYTVSGDILMFEKNGKVVGLYTIKELTTNTFILMGEQTQTGNTLDYFAKRSND